jgi:hypothetical protein
MENKITVTTAPLPIRELLSLVKSQNQQPFLLYFTEHGIGLKKFLSIIQLWSDILFGKITVEHKRRIALPEAAILFS